jgi:hypothetical protein
VAPLAASTRTIPADQRPSVKDFLLNQQFLKGQCHEIFDPLFFRQSITHMPLINTLKYFQILFRIRRAIYENVLIPRYAA